MNRTTKAVAILLIVGVLLVAGRTPVSAQALGIPAGEPNPSANPVLANMIKLGSRLYYLGARSGMDGWLILKDSQIQIAYDIPGSQDLIIGALFGPSGENVTAAQVQAVLDSHPDVKNTLVSAAGQALPGASAAGAAGVVPAAAAALQTQAAQLTANLPSASAAPLAAALSPGERLLEELRTASGQNLGSPSAPQLMMVMDPTCPHCQKTWKELRSKVFANALQVRLIPVTRDPDDAEEVRASAELLHSADPLNAWDKFAAGDKIPLQGTPDLVFVQAVKANHELIDRWHIEQTPFLVYRGKDGKVKIVQGEPDKPDALIADIAP